MLYVPDFYKLIKYFSIIQSCVHSKPLRHHIEIGVETYVYPIFLEFIRRDHFSMHNLSKDLKGKNRVAMWNLFCKYMVYFLVVILISSNYGEKIQLISTLVS